MKKYYNGTLFTLLSFLFCFNLYGQIGAGLMPGVLTCLKANADLIIEDVIWDANVSDLISFYEEHDSSFQPDVLITDLNGIPIPESFHLVELGHSIPKPSSWWSTFTFDISVAPTAKPVVFVYIKDSNFSWAPIIDQNGYIVGMRIDHQNGTGVASTVSAMGRFGGGSNVFDMCIDIIATNRILDLRDLADASYSSCRTIRPFNKEAQDISTLQSMDIYPNPTQNNLFVETNNADVQKIELFTLQGQIQNQVSIRYGVDKIQVNTSSLQSGIYLLKLETATETIIEKIIIQ